MSKLTEWISLLLPRFLKTTVPGSSPPRHPPPSKLAAWLREMIQLSLSTAIGSLFVLTFVGHTIQIRSGSMKNSLLVGDYLLVTTFGVDAQNGLRRFPPYREIRRGDIIVFKLPQNLTTNDVKRVIGLPGEMIEIRGATVFINGKELVEHRKIINLEYDRLHTNHPLQTLGEDPSPDDRVHSVSPSYWTYYGQTKPGSPEDTAVSNSLSTLGYGVGSPYRIPLHHFFCLGDNRDNSEDSRVWGSVPRENIIGRPVIIFFSQNPDEQPENPEANFLPQPRWERIGTRVQ